MSKEAQRAELHRTIWRIANDLRGSVDGWDFKQYVLGLLFYRFISENLAAYLNDHEHRAGDAEFDYARLADVEAEFGRAETVAEKASTSCRVSCSSTSVAALATTRTSTRRSKRRSTTSRAQRLAPTASTTSRVCSTTSM